MKTFTYFSGAQDGNDPTYMEEAEKLGHFMGQQACKLKYGGSATGMMGAFCRGAIKGREETKQDINIIGVVAKKYLGVNKPNTLPIDVVVTETLTERKEKLLDDSDVFIIFPGGTGTLDELFEIIEQDYLPADRDPTYTDFGIRPIFVYNFDGYYNGLIQQLENIKDRGFISRDKLEKLQFFNTFKDITTALEQANN